MKMFNLKSEAVLHSSGSCRCRQAEPRGKLIHKNNTINNMDQFIPIYETIKYPNTLE